MPIDQGNGYYGQNSGIVPLIIRLPFEVKLDKEEAGENAS
ncbi:hypothetical protein L195_g045514 [Trifolium pratense]|uniref:Uncharacterized protein n=1 Tax=Trifolium pratense TaxID=57577 RepID=A0A2K3LLD2_TRIPR|nr:hypothetical protein L195_g035320 [Trifolium pratense]PNX89395.1 hypothetical protein L195_g045514 [Trifolium pratense]